MVTAAADRCHIMMKSFSYDLHIHSCLSPCGSEEMTPATIAGMAAVKGLEVAALTDHSSCKNCPAFMKAAEFYGITGIPGMELTTSEEVHVLCLFPTLEAAMDFDGYIHTQLPEVENSEAIFGSQLVMDEDDNITAREPYLLINATSVSFDSVFDLVGRYGGVMVPAHLDKSTTSLLSNLGFIPPDSRFTTAEIHNKENILPLLERHEYLRKCRILTSSDAHYLKDISEPVNFLHAEERSAAAVISALRSAQTERREPRA